ncbi:MAG: EexN family lipoprotein [Acidithiobacillus sp.]
MLKKVTLPVMVIVLAGCSSFDQGPEGGHNVSWYLHHQEKMSQELAWCNNTTGRDKLESCKNAQTASDKALGYNAKRTLRSLGNAL